MPETTFGSLLAKASAINGIKHKELFLRPKNGTDRIFEEVAGVVAEWGTSYNPSPPEKISRIEAAITPGLVEEYYRRAEFDLIRFKLYPGDEHKPVATYGGTSGGGLWQISFKDEIDGTKSLTGFQLIGVAFYEKRIGKGEIICHGPEAIYNKLFEQMQNKWPGEIV